MQASFQIELVCSPLPAPDSHCLMLGIQLGDAVSADLPYAGLAEARFQIELAAVLDSSNSALRFKGKAVHGTSAQPFLYLCWGDRVEGIWVMARRSKIILATLPRLLLSEALDSGRGIRAQLNLVDPRGLPASGSLKPERVLWTRLD